MLNQYLLIFLYVLADIFIMFGLKILGGFDILLLDSTRISLMIIGLYFASNFLILFNNMKPENRYVKRSLEWTGGSFMLIGLLGTVIGMFLIFYNLLSNVDMSNIADSAPEILLHMSSGFSVATLTTITGIICTLLFTFKFIFYSKKVAQ